MKKLLFVCSCFAAYTSLAQPTNIYQPAGSTTNFGKTAYDSFNYYVVNYPSLQLMKIDPTNTATLITTLTADPFQTMIWNDGKGIYPVANGSPFKLFDGTSAIDITGGQLPMAGYTTDKAITPDNFHKGNTTYFRTANKIYKTDFTSPASIQTLASVEYSVGTTEMQHTANSIFFSDVSVTSPAPNCIKRIDLNTGLVTKVDSAVSGTYDYGAVYNNDYYYCTPYDPSSVGNSKIIKISDNGTGTVLYTETATNKHFQRIIGVTPHGVIALLSTVSIGVEYVSVSGGVVTPLNFNTTANSLPCGNVGVGTSRTTKTLVYFNALDTLYTVSSTNTALWVTDGTIAGTRKIVGGTPATFAVNGLSTQFPGSAEHCDDDLYFSGQNGSAATRLIYVNGSTYAVTTNPFGLPNPATIRKTTSGILMIGSPLPTTSAEKAVYKANCGTTTGVEEINTGGSVSVYPNPANGLIHIDLLEAVKDYIVRITNQLGQVVYQQDHIKDNNTTVNLSGQATGIYFIQIMSAEKMYAVEKVVKQ